MTVAVTGSPKSYAECLMKLSGLKGKPRAMQSAPAVFARSGLGARVAKIVSPRQQIAPVWSRTLAVAMVLVLCSLSVGVCGVTLVEVTTFAEPALSAAIVTRSIPADRPVAVATSAPSVMMTKRSPGRAVSRSSSPHRPKTKQLSRSSRPTIEATAPPRSLASNAVIPLHAAEVDPQVIRAVAADAPPAPRTPQASPNATSEPPRSPWSAAADGGTAIGRKSRNAGVATAGAFTRFARRVAGSF
jgi:hypothetical protein